MDEAGLTIPSYLLPADGRFGSGPSRVRPAAVEALAETGRAYLGTSHRRPAVRSMVARLREGLRALYGLPDGYDVVLGNGGATAFWDAAAFCLIEHRSQHLVFGEFSGKFAAVARAAPHLADPHVVESPPGTHPDPDPGADADVDALTHNETSTGVTAPVVRVRDSALVVVDATSAAGAVPVDPSAFDVYYFSPQKAFAADGGLWAALCSPAALGRIEAVAASDRRVPAFLDLALAVENSRKDQTYNTPALATLFLFVHQLEWIIDRGGLAWASERCTRSSGTVYRWADSRPFAEPFVADPAMRSTTVATIDFTGVDASLLARILRANGIVDTESYRKLGRNQLRIGTFPAVEPSDVEALTAAIDWVVERVG